MDKRKLDISNYEEWFIDYLDGTLSALEQEELNSFLDEHPELAEELKEMGPITLESERNYIPEKSSLYDARMNDLIMEAVEKGMSFSELDVASQSKVAQKEFELYKHAILKADSALVFPDKASLKRREAPIIPLWIQRTAIAAALAGVIVDALLPIGETRYEPRLAEQFDLGIDVDDVFIADRNEFELYIEKEDSLPIENRVSPNQSIPQPFVIFSEQH